jgi:hypothetical protein
MNLYLICAGVLVIFFFAISLNVSRLRVRHNVLIGSDDFTHPLTKAVRAQANAAEYVPVLVAIFLYLSIIGTAAWVAWIAVIVTLARLLHCAGMYLSPDLNKPHPLRLAGALLTYLGGLALGILLLARALM